MARPTIPAVGDPNWGEPLRQAIFVVSDKADAAGTTGSVTDGGVTTAKLADGAVTNIKTATGISADKLVDGTTNHAFTAADDDKLAILDSTSDLSKPVSTAQATAIALKANFINSVKFVRKDPTTGFWPASYLTDGTPVYTSGSASVAARPTASLACMVFWVGADPSPGSVASGTGGMMQGLDQRIITT